MPKSMNDRLNDALDEVAALKAKNQQLTKTMVDSVAMLAGTPGDERVVKVRNKLWLALNNNTSD